MLPKKHIIIFSHGFGVRKDDCGLLSDIANALPETETILFDYFKIDEKNHTLTTCPISEQVKILNGVIDKTKQLNPGTIIDLICHSQGTVVAAFAKPEGIRKAIMLAPVFDMNLERTLARYANRPGAEINLNGVSKLPPVDGLTRIVPAEYFQERVNMKTFDAYNAFAEKTELIMIEANQDQILAKVDLIELNKNIKLTALDGDHNFNGLAREPLIREIRKYII